MKSWSRWQWTAAIYLACFIVYFTYAIFDTVLLTSKIDKHKQCIKATQAAVIASAPLPWCIGALP